jgi:hypothetical protein
VADGGHAAPGGCVERDKPTRSGATNGRWSEREREAHSAYTTSGDREVITSDAIAELGAVLAGIEAPLSSAMLAGLSLLIVAVTLYVDRLMTDRR